MSSLLEQAIIDAKALKEAALKNAEQMVIEKYSDQIKEAVTSFLDEEDDEMMGMDALDSMEEPVAELSVADKSDEEALEEIKRCSGSQFDPVVVNAFLKVPVAEVIMA